MLDNSDEAFREFALSLGRVDRLGEPEDIAAAVAFLMSDDASWITAPGDQRRRRFDAAAMSGRAPGNPIRSC